MTNFDKKTIFQNPPTVFPWAEDTGVYYPPSTCTIFIDVGK